jgi:predicted DNA-binding transcriptional regulator AlpA
MENQRWGTEKEAASLMAYGVQTLRNQRFRGEGPPYSKIGRSIRYKISDVIEFMESRKVVPRNEK